MKDPIIDLPTSEATHTVAGWLMKSIDSVLNLIGLEHYQNAEDGVYLTIVIVAAFFVGWIIQKVVYFILKKAVAMRNGVIGNELLQWNTLQKCCYVIPPLVFLGLAPFAFESKHHTMIIIERVAGIYALFTFGIGLSAVLDFLFNHYNIHRNTKNLPIKGILNTAKGILWIVLIIISVSVAVDKSPAILLTGLGAFAAALMLVFKDSILGLVSGIQMSQNDMLHVGDWIVVPGTPVNGVVTDVSLSTVKVRNFDNTITTVPPYTLVSGSFQNWRGMSSSGCRRISKTFTIDITTVAPVTADQVAVLVAKYPILKPFVDKLQASKSTTECDGGITPINGSIDTNLGLFRAYCCEYIYNNPLINNTQQILVRILDPNSTGLPLELYCFAATTDWNKYEGIQSALMEHIATVVGDFGLSIYTSGSLTISQENPAQQPAPAEA